VWDTLQTKYSFGSCSKLYMPDRWVPIDSLLKHKPESVGGSVGMSVEKAKGVIS
jgi:hypothetical protein